jgi:hypothetical protein
MVNKRRIERSYRHREIKKSGGPKGDIKVFFKEKKKNVAVN